MNKWSKIFTIMILLMAFMYIYNTTCAKTFKNEGFTQISPYVFKSDSEIYDKFYSNIYDDLQRPEKRVQSEYDIISKYINTAKSHNVLDIGSGTGDLMQKLDENNVVCHGLEKMPHMIQRSLKKYPQISVHNGDAMDPTQFDKSSVSHICVMNFTLYHFDNKDAFFKNCRSWLHHKGYLILHLVDKNTYDATVPAANPLLDATPQTYASERLKKTHIDFIEFDYVNAVDFDNKDHRVVIKETFTNKYDSKIRVNELTLYMEQKENIVELCKHNGFVVVDTFILHNDIGQYIYVFQKRV